MMKKNDNDDDDDDEVSMRQLQAALACSGRERHLHS